MKKEHVESLEDIIFKDRNKNYGAYDLRKKYNSQIIISLLIAVLFVGTALTYPLMNNKREEAPKQKPDSVFITTDFVKKELPMPELPPPPAQPMHERSIKDLALVTPTVTDGPVEGDFGKQDLLADNKSPITTTMDIPVAVSDDKPEPVIPQPVKAEPVLWVPEMPGFPGGESALQKFLQNRIKYPKEAKEAGIQGTVFLRFIVEPDGSITNISIMRGIGGGCEEEGMNVVKSMPNWVPGKQNGIPVRVILTLPVKFVLQ